MQLLDPAAYARRVQLRVSPEPDTLIRSTMRFRCVEVPQAVGAPELPTHERRGFCVIEWGGIDLDERHHSS